MGIGVGIGVGGGSSGAAGGAPSAKAATVSATATGPVYTIARLLGSTSTLALIGGTNSNLTINATTGVVSAAAAIGNGNSQVAVVREVNGLLAQEYPLTLSGPVTAPAAPTLIATPGNAQVSLALADGATGGSPITSHNLYVGTASGSETALGPVTFPYIDSGLTNGARRYYRASAVNTVGESPLSAEVAATPSANDNNLDFSAANNSGFAFFYGVM